MSTISSQVHRAKSESINDQIMLSSDEVLNRRFRSSSRDECNRDSNLNEVLNNTCDSWRKRQSHFKLRSILDLTRRTDFVHAVPQTDYDNLCLTQKPGV